METRSIRTLKLIGGWLCLDFLNTAGLHATEHKKEFLRSYFDLVDWFNYAGVITDDDKRRLLDEAEKNPVEAERVLHRAIELREIIFQVFLSISRNTFPRQKDMDRFNKKLSKMMGQSKLELTNKGVEWDTMGNNDSLDWMLNSVIQSAFSLLTSKELDRVKICADERGCGWLFYDNSKNKSRRWCDMTDCGNVAKQKRFHNRGQ
jgi:predicted RNA-binding Zn ribbon-like protein